LSTTAQLISNRLAPANDEMSTRCLSRSIALFAISLAGLETACVAPGPSEPAKADVVLAPLFSDHAVLQRGKPVPIWGRAGAADPITVTFRGQSVYTTAGKDGRWIVYLKPLTASSEPADLVVVGHNTVTLHDVIVGEVWLCSGQSNMEFSVGWPRTGKDAEPDVTEPGHPENREPELQGLVVNEEAEAAEANYPLIRQLHIERTHSTFPSDTVRTRGWQAASRETVGHFTAVGYFFARDLNRAIGVPVGIIASSWGNTPIQQWMINGSDYEGMIAPLEPGAIRGFLWYQGESNLEDPGHYAGLFAELIRSWRTAWGQGDLPFYFVQLANFSDKRDASDRSWARLREAQAHVLSLPNTAMAVTIDIGDATNIHWGNKQELGRRLALIAKAQLYGVPPEFSGPLFASAVREGAALRVRFTHAGTELSSRGGPVTALELAGADKVFHGATAVIETDTLLVSSPEVSDPVAVRYAWTNAPAANLYNDSGLPAVPFRSDNW
jgi:sialate O-acetylesterase